MDVIFDVYNLKFGDRLRMRDGNMAVFLSRRSDDYITVAIRQGENDYYAAHYRIYQNRLVSQYKPHLNVYDIIGYWEE